MNRKKSDIVCIKARGIAICRQLPFTNSNSNSNQNQILTDSVADYPTFLLCMISFTNHTVEYVYKEFFLLYSFRSGAVAVIFVQALAPIISQFRWHTICFLSQSQATTKVVTLVLFNIISDSKSLKSAGPHSFE